MSAPEVSIVMRSFNEGWALRDTLAMLRKQIGPSWELIVIDSGSSDGSVEIIREFGPAHFVRIASRDYVPGRVMNHGMRLARANTVLFLNADATPVNESWLWPLANALQAANVAAVFGKQKPRPDCRAVFACDYERCYGEQRESATWDHFFSMVSSGLRKDIWSKRGFLENLQYAEDDEYTRWAKANGYQVVYCPESVAIHSHNYTAEQSYKRAFGDAKALAASWAGKHSDFNWLKTVAFGWANDVRHDPVLSQARLLRRTWPCCKDPLEPKARTSGWVSRRLENLSCGHREHSCDGGANSSCGMKILVLTNLYPPHYLGGYELICHAVVNTLRARGHEVQVLTSNHRVENPKGVEDPQIERSLCVHGFYGHPWLGIQSLVKLEIENNRILQRALDRHRPELVYVWNMGGISKSLLTTLERSKIPTAFYMSDHWIARGLAADVWMNWWNGAGSSAKKIARSLLTVCGARSVLDRLAPTTSAFDLKFRRIYFCSKALRKITASAGYDVMHGSVIYCPVDTAKFNGPARTREQQCKNLLWVGRLAEDKGVLTALRAMKALPEGTEVHLNIFGGGDAPYVQQLRDFAQSNRLPVTFKRAGMDEMPRVYREHDALIFTSEWAEPFALTPLEAMASGLPVIGTTTGGSRELFRDHDNSLTYTAGEPNELADRIVRVVSDSELRARIAATGQAEVRANYDEVRIVDQIEAYLKETVQLWPTLR